MTGPEHYHRAEQLAEAAARGEVELARVQVTIALAQVHATLALAAPAAEATS